MLVEPEAPPNWVLVQAKNGFFLWRAGDQAMLRDADGKALSKAMVYEEALKAFDRFSTRR